MDKIKFLMDEPDKKYLLTIEQQKLLDSQINLDKNLYTDAEALFTGLKKYKIIKNRGHGRLSNFFRQGHNV